MKRMGFIIVTVLILAITVMMPHSSKAGGLSTQIGEVVVENLQIGQTYNLKELANLRMTARNTGEDVVNLKMDVLRPESRELRQGAAAIPDISWVTLSQDSFTVEPMQPATSDIIISIPDERQYLGKKFQVIIWSHTVGTGSTFMEVGLKSRIIFSIDSVKADVDKLVFSGEANLDFSLQPEEIHLDNVPLGTSYDITEKTRRVLTITNSGDHQKAFRLQSRTVESSSATLTDQYEDAPNASYLRFSDNEFELAPKETKIVNMYLNFPANAEFNGKHYMFIIHVYSGDAIVTTGVYSRLYVSVGDDN